MTIVNVKLVEEPSPFQANATIWRAYYQASDLPLYIGAETKQDLKDRVSLYLHPRSVRFTEEVGHVYQEAK